MTLVPLPIDSETPDSVRAELIQAGLHHIERRQWWLWSTAVLVTLLLALGMASFAFPGLLSQAEDSFTFFLGQALRGLVGLVLIFNVYTVYQQLQIHRIQAQLSDQIALMGKMQARTDEVYKLAVLDALTGLYNRRSGEQRLAEEVLRAQRHDRPLTVLLCDIDGLKRVNDTYGHLAGDQLIKRFSERLQRAIRGSDLAIRLGGDEFVVLLPECKLDEVHHVLGRLRGGSIEADGHTIPITFSAGWADYVPGESPEELLKRADFALYANKRAGKEESNLNIVTK
jgi:diguanylate cyclase (GGDEF)-like protein